ncbi:hypothetical protein STRNTR1_3400 [Stenotrophomonas maltophilia]|nr:hypothetical protein STRNTR1_3400 [Stenotrophomonas maltophilia]
MGSRIVRRCRAGRPTLVGGGVLFCRACSPAPAEAEAKAKAKAKATADYPWEGGMGPVAGDAVNPAPRSGPAAGDCAFGRLRSSASQAKHPHPWGLGRGIHAADTPATGPTPPSTDSAICRNGVLPWWVSTLVDTVDPRHAWMIHSISDRKIVSTKVDTYQQRRRTTAAVINSRRNLSKVGRCRSAGCQPHGPEACLGRVG